MRYLVVLGIALTSAGCASVKTTIVSHASGDPIHGAAVDPSSGINPTSGEWSAYSGYLHQAFDKIQANWDRILDAQKEPSHRGYIRQVLNDILANRRRGPPAGSYVKVKFRLSSSGRVTEILEVESTSTSGGVAACLSAITLPAFGAWTNEMVTSLGSSEDITITFYYE
jgi:hypothetical protein